MKAIIFSMMAAIALLSCTKERAINGPGNLVPETVDQDLSLSSITVNGTKLHAEAFGHPDSTMIIMIHGGPGSDYRSLLNAQELAGAGFRVVFYDQRGSGLSQRHTKKSYTNLGEGAIDVFCEDLAAVINHYRTGVNQKVILFGHSWGAMLATKFTGKHPGAVDGLIVAEPGGLKWDDVETYVEKAMSFNIWSELQNDATYLDQFISGKEDQHETLDYKLAMLSSNNEITGEDNTLPGSFWRSGAVLSMAFFEIGKDHEPDFSEGIQNFSKPVLFIYSEKNKAYPASWADKIADAYNNVQVFKAAGSDHASMISNPAIWSQTTMPRVVSYINSL